MGKLTGIYRIMSPSGRVYIGQSRDIESRFKSHTKRSSRCFALYASFDKYGIENHKFEIIHELPFDVTGDVLNNYEILYIDLYRSAGIKMCNIKSGGYGGGKGANVTQKVIDTNRRVHTGNTIRRGAKLSDESKAKISKSRKGISAWNKGVPCNEEIKVKISNKLKGRKIPKDVVEKMRMKSLGHKVSESTRAKIGQKHRGKTLTQDQRKRLREVNIGKKHSEDTKKKMSNAHKGRPKSKASILKRTITRRLKRINKSKQTSLWE